MKVLLIHTPTLELDNFLPPLGILYIAAVLKKNGYEVRIIDKDPEYFNIIPDIKSFDPDLIGLSFMTPSCQRAHSLCKILRKEFPGKILFSGGTHTSAAPEKTLKDLDLDFVVVGEGEETILEICKNIQNKKSLQGVKGVIFKEKGILTNNGCREFISNLDTIPFPARDLLNFNKEYLVYPGIIRGYGCKSTMMITSRGCPYNCIYCGSPVIFGNKVRYRSVKSVIDEIKQLIDLYGAEGTFFADDTFTINPQRVIKFCHAFKREKLDFVWACQARVNTVSDELLREMKSGGCIQVDFGVESGSQKILDILKKGTTPEMIKKAFQLAKKNKLRTLATFMVNNPFETKEDLKKTFQLAKEISPDFTTFFYATPLPGTELYELAKQQNWIDEKSLYSEIWNYRNAQLPVMNNNTDLSKEEIMHARSKMQNHFFFKNYIRWNNMLIGINILSKSLKKPHVFIEAFKKVRRTGKLDQAFEVVLAKSKLD